MGVVILDQPQYVVDKAILLYKHASAGHSYSHADRGLVMVHDVTTDEHDRAVIGAGTPASVSAVSQALAGVLGRHGELEFIPSAMLAQGGRTMVWYMPASVRPMFFNVSTPNGREEVAGSAWQPPLVFAVHEEAWYVWALKQDERPTPMTPLYHAPYMNVWKSGKICTGNVRTPSGTRDEMNHLAWELVFFNSWFTHLNDIDQKRFKRRKSLFSYWKQAIKKQTPFPVHDLVPNGHTLKDVLKAISRP